METIELKKGVNLEDILLVGEVSHMAKFHGPWEVKSNEDYTIYEGNFSKNLKFRLTEYTTDSYAKNAGLIFIKSLFAIGGKESDEIPKGYRTVMAYGDLPNTDENSYLSKLKHGKWEKIFENSYYAQHARPPEVHAMTNDDGLRLKFEHFCFIYEPGYRSRRPSACNPAKGWL